MRGIVLLFAVMDCGGAHVRRCCAGGNGGVCSGRLPGRERQSGVRSLRYPGRGRGQSRGRLRALYRKPRRHGPHPSNSHATYEYDPAWSPDGTRIAFVRDDPRDGYEIYTMAAAGGEPRHVTDNEIQDTEPTWSPDGTTI